jgi:serine/threonine protein kinase
MKTLGKFEILEKLGQGAMGVVYKARDPRIGRMVALKTITTGLADDPALLQRFYQEAHSAGTLQHPNIVTIYEMGEEDNTPFIAMEYLDGQSLDKLIERRHALPLSQKVGYIAYLCRALAFAHKQGIVHRDIKPANVMVTRTGTVKVVDFGIARIAENSRSQTGLVIGTLGYMSPQQIDGARADARSDIWAAGVLFYELLAYRRPFEGDNYGALMKSIITQEMPPLSETAPGTPSDVAAVIDRMLQKEIDQRFQSMEDALLELEPVWKRLQHDEVSELLTATRERLLAGDVEAANEMARKVLQIDMTNAEAKKLLDQTNTQLRLNRVAPSSEKNPQTDETLVLPAINRPTPSATPSPVPVAVVEKKEPVRRESSSPAPVQAEILSQKQPAAVALAVLFGIIILGGGGYYWKSRQPGAATSGALGPRGAAVSNPPAGGGRPQSAPDSPINAPSVPPTVSDATSGNVAPTAVQNRQTPTVTNSAGGPGRVQDLATNNPGANPRTSASPATLPPPQARNTQGGTTQVVAPETPAQDRTVVASNTPAVAPSSDRPGQPTTAIQQQVMPVSQPASTTAISPASKAPEPAPPPPSKASEPPVVAASAPDKPPPDSLDRQEIGVVLQQLSAAFSRKSLSEMDAIWPKNSSKGTFRKSFDSFKAFTREFHAPSITFSNDGNTATAIGTYEGAVRDGRGVDTPSSGNFYVRFFKKNGRWFIDDANF